MSKPTAFEDLEEAMIGGAPVPPIYLQACEAMGLALKGALQMGRDPRFRLGPPGVCMIGPCIVPALCQNDAARSLVSAWVQLGQALAEAVPTVRMVEAVLIAQRHPFERAATVGELGIDA